MQMRAERHLAAPGPPIINYTLLTWPAALQSGYLAALGNYREPRLADGIHLMDQERAYRTPAEPVCLGPLAFTCARGWK